MLPPPNSPLSSCSQALPYLTLFKLLIGQPDTKKRCSSWLVTDLLVTSCTPTGLFTHTVPCVDSNTLSVQLALTQC